MSVNLMRVCVLLVVGGVLMAAQAQANFPTVPKETYEALKIERSASPKELYDTRLKEKLELQARVAKLEGQMKHSWLDLDSDSGKLSLGGLGGGLMLAGTMALAGWRRRKQ
jgi:hypothetical protein